MINTFSAAYQDGEEDGRRGVAKNTAPYGTYQQRLDYSAGWDAGEAMRTATLEPITTDERRFLYGEEHDQV